MVETKTAIPFTPVEIEQLGSERYVAVRETFKDDTYAAPLKVHRVQRIVDEFDWALFLRPLVSERRPGMYAVLDGNHRIEAVRRKFGTRTEVPVIVVSGLSLEEEAAIFTEMNARRRVMEPGEIYKGQLAAREPDALSMQAILDARGIKIGSKATVNSPTSRVIRGVATAINIHKTGNLDETLDILLEAWPKEPRKFSVPAMQSISYFLHGYPNADRKRLVQVLKRQSPDELDRALRASRTVLGGNKKGYVGRAVLVAWYNERLTKPENRLKP